nr:RICIN domain-containing protein [Actinoplanes derwentensis]
MNSSAAAPVAQSSRKPAPSAAAAGASRRPSTGSGGAKPSEQTPAPSGTPESSTAAKASGQTGLPLARVADGAAVQSQPYFVRNLAVGHCFDLEWYDKGRPDLPVNQFACRPTEPDNQEWRFVPRFDADGYHLYWIQNIDDDLCLDPLGVGSVESGSKLTEMVCYEEDNQEFRLEPKGTSGGLRYFWLRNVASGLCIAVASETEGDQLILDSCEAGDDRRWALLTKTDF